MQKEPVNKSADFTIWNAFRDCRHVVFNNKYFWGQVQHRVKKNNNLGVNRGKNQNNPFINIFDKLLRIYSL